MHAALCVQHARGAGVREAARVLEAARAGKSASALRGSAVYTVRVASVSPSVSAICCRAFRPP